MIVTCFEQICKQHSRSLGCVRNSLPETLRAAPFSFDSVYGSNQGPADYFPWIRVVSVTEGQGSIKHVHAKTVKPELDQNGKQKQHPASPEDDQRNLVDSRGVESDARGVTPVDMDVSGEVNMEAFITSNDVMRAGGFGARDDISSFLPVASDSTDF
ncbi:hypothetical protein RJ639_008708 [Escallonia herrerae]|uniref:Uncharacterized protein n=1 Tax=Escallonia herrerae TaxID=1293975 RepID=A0AA89ATL1_9ASTE|nr:hypothetical protein RJ639_008708 [Escallonia herrerae]